MILYHVSEIFRNALFEGGVKVKWQNDFWGNQLFPLPLEGCHLLAFESSSSYMGG